MSFLLFAGVDWWYHSHAHADVQLAKNLAATEAVLFVNSIGMRMPLPGNTEQPLRRVFKKMKSTFKLLRRPELEKTNFGILSAISLPLFAFPRGAALNSIAVAIQVKLACCRVGVRRPVCIVTIPTAIDVVERLNVADVWYYRSDNHRADPGVDRALITVYEERLFARATRVLYSSQALMEAEKGRHQGKAVFFDQGIDAGLFMASDAGDEPADLACIPHPRVGYYGQLEPHGVDMKLLLRTAREIPEAHFVLIGTSAVDTSELSALRNVHLLGYKPHAEIPSYGHGFDVALMPRPDTEWSRSSNPIKLKEYLALGLPIVTTWLPEVEYYKDVVCIARTPDDFVAAVRASLIDGGVGTVALRKQRVANATWANRANEIISFVRAQQTVDAPTVS